MDEKYIDLLLKRCTTLNKVPILFLHYNKEIQPFINKIEAKLKNKNIDIYLDCIDPNKEHDFLKNHSLEEIKESNYFDCSIWDKYASLNASFLIIETEYPHLIGSFSVNMQILKIASFSNS